jgi:hypothetical protein
VCSSGLMSRSFAQVACWPASRAGNPIYDRIACIAGRGFKLRRAPLIAGYQSASRCRGGSVRRPVARGRTLSAGDSVRRAAFRRSAAVTLADGCGFIGSLSQPTERPQARPLISLGFPFLRGIRPARQWLECASASIRITAGIRKQCECHRIIKGLKHCKPTVRPERNNTPDTGAVTWSKGASRRSPYV